MKNKPTFSASLSIAALGLFLVALMTGCSGTSTLTGTSPSVGNATPTTSSVANTAPTALSEVNVTPTTPSTDTTPTTTTSTAKLQTYTCDFFQVNYPDPWQVMIGRSNQVELGGTNKSSLDITAQPNTSQSAEQEITTIIQARQNEYTNFQPVDLQPSITIGGQSWRQVTWTGTNKSSGLSFKGRDDVVNYNGRLYIISYYALVSDFDQNNTQYFQVIEQSFAFK
jgi:hypothetical protein